ncbi:MerR family transcriptional regulator [Desulfovibrio mangrovi]|uniref:MerR family transcriptional regulator n=1 Tax=Desulfovibrio mangrovi TaxID=2976983 RepID=UPI002245A41F|nr:MerR family transcriptional regulator [Desulfovibrio mangrovi]UZP66623.1 MerR family transcriptional regulator [Desulfovibrio mangrovi]
MTPHAQSCRHNFQRLAQPCSQVALPLIKLFGTRYANTQTRHYERERRYAAPSQQASKYSITYTCHQYAQLSILHLLTQQRNIMTCKAKYSIGDVSRICNVSKKTLRYYDDINLITPIRHDHNNYRYYTRDAILTVPIIKYYKQMGFTLDEMRFFIEGIESNSSYNTLKHSFISKIKELKRLKNEIQKQYISIKDWHDLITEAEIVMANNSREVSIKYIETTEYVQQKQVFNNDFKGSIINIEWTNYIDSLNIEVTGPVVINFLSLKKRLDEHPKHVRILQKPLHSAPVESLTSFGECMMASCYHIGPHENIGETYKKMFKWAEHYSYAFADESYERYVADYWSTRNSEQFVTEVLIKVER